MPRSAPHHAHPLRRLARALLILGVLIAPLLVGAVHPWAFAALALLTLLAAAALLLGPDPGPGSLPSGIALAAGGLVALAALQLLPLPAALIERLAPDRLEAHRALLGESSDPGTALRLPRFVPLSLAPALTRLDLVRLALPAAFLLCIARAFRHQRERLALAFAIAGAGGLAALLGILQFAQGVRQPWFRVAVPPNAQPFGPYVNRNHFAGLAALCLPVAIALAAIAWAERRREPGRALGGLVVGGGSAALMAAGLLLAGSRGGFLAALGGVALLGVLVRRLNGRRGFARAAWTTAAIAGALLLLVDRGSTLARLASIDDTDGSARTRLVVWRSALAIFARHPLAGAGFGAFEDVLPAHKASPLPWYFEHPENDYLWLAAEGGFPGLALGSMLLLTTALAVRRRLRGPPPDPADGLRARASASLWAAAAAGLAAVAMHGLVDVNLHIPANGLIAASLLALLAAGGIEGAERPVLRRPSRARQAAILAGALLASIPLGRILAGDWLGRSAAAARRAGRPPAEEVARLERAIAIDPGRSDLLRAAGNARSRLALDPALDPAAAVGQARHARQDLLAALRLRPRDAAAVYELGWLLSLAPAEDEAAALARARWGEALLRHATRLDPSFPGLRARLGLVLAVGHPDRAVEGLELLRAALAEEPALQDELLPVLALRLRPAGLGRAVPDTPENRFRFASWLEGRGDVEGALGQYARALALAAPLREGRDAWRLKVADRHLHAGRHALALPLLEGLAGRVPRDVAYLRRLAAALTGTGHYPQARQALEEALGRARLPDLEQQLAWVAYNLDDCLTALAAARNALRANPQNPQALLVTGLCQARNGELGSAYATLKRVQALAPELQLTGEALAQVERRMAEALGPAAIRSDDSR